MILNSEIHHFVNLYISRCMSTIDWNSMQCGKTRHSLPLPRKFFPSNQLGVKFVRENVDFTEFLRQNGGIKIELITLTKKNFVKSTTYFAISLVKTLLSRFFCQKVWELIFLQKVLSKLVIYTTSVYNCKPNLIFRICILHSVKISEIYSRSHYVKSWYYLITLWSIFTKIFRWE